MMSQRVSATPCATIASPEAKLSGKMLRTWVRRGGQLRRVSTASPTSTSAACRKEAHSGCERSLFDPAVIIGASTLPFRVHRAARRPSGSDMTIAPSTII